MGVGVSYMGHDGRSLKANLEGLPDAQKLLDQMMEDVKNFKPRQPAPGGGDSSGRIRRIAKQEITKVAGKVSLGLGDEPDYLSKKVDSGGSLEAGNDGLRLKGDFGGFGVAPGMVYGVPPEKNQQGFVPLAKMDPPADGALVGPEHSTDTDPNGASRSADSKTPFRTASLSRMVLDYNEQTKTYTLYAYTREETKTGFGRTTKVSPERRSIVGTWREGGAAGNFWVTDGDETTCRASKIQIGDTFIYYIPDSDGGE